MSKLSINVTGIGSLPFSDQDLASAFISRNCPELPFTPQLHSNHGSIAPMSHDLLQTSADLLEVGSSPFSVRPGFNMVEPFLEELERVSKAVPRYFLELDLPSTHCIKTQLVGPGTLARYFDLSGIDPHIQERVKLALDRAVSAQVRARVSFLSERYSEVTLFLDEPVLGLLSEDRKAALNRSLLAGKERGAKVGIHSCGPFAPNVFVEIDADMFSFDVTNFNERAKVFCSPELKDYLISGRSLALGVVPTSGELSFETSTAALLAIEALCQDSGLKPEAIYRNALLTHTCGLYCSTEEFAEQSFQLANQISAWLRKRWCSNG